MTLKEYQVLARRYRPQTFKEVVGQKAAVTTLKNALKMGKLAHAYLFCGSRGIGKTTLARLFAKALNCKQRTEELEPCNQCSSCLEITRGQSLDVIEIDGASNRGIDDIRQINETVHYAPSHGLFKIYLIDEVHMLTKEAFNALLKTLEEPPESVKFFFATTEPHKVLPTIVSRCQRFDLTRIEEDWIVGKLSQIAQDLGKQVELDALHLMASFSEGSLRDAESLFDQILCFTNDTITTEEVRSSLGLLSQEAFFSLDQAFDQYDLSFAFSLVEKLFESGKDPLHFFSQLVEHVRLLLKCKLQPPQKSSPLLKQHTLSARFYTATQCLYLLEYLLKQEPLLQRSVHQRTFLEALLLHYLQSKHRVPVEVLMRKVLELEEQDTESKEDPLPIPSQEALKTNVVEGQPLPKEKPPLPTEPEKPLLTPPQEVSEIKTIPPFDSLTEKKGALDPSPELTNVPFSPNTPEEPSLEKKKEVALDCPSQVESCHETHASRYDTLVRFAAVELEGTVKTR